MGHHDHQPVFCHFFAQIHDLDGCLAVQGSCRLVGQQDVRVVYKRPCDGHPLHLTSGHLVGLFVQLVAQAHFFKGPDGSGTPFLFVYAGNGQCQFHIGKNALMRYQVVALENKADGMVPV